jgi:hypothetical protein
MRTRGEIPRIHRRRRLDLRPKFPPKCVDRMREGRWALQCRFLKNASSSLFILFGPQAVPP